MAGSSVPVAGSRFGTTSTTPAKADPLRDAVKRAATGDAPEAKALRARIALMRRNLGLR